MNNTQLEKLGRDWGDIRLSYRAFEVTGSGHAYTDGFSAYMTDKKVPTRVMKEGRSIPFETVEKYIHRYPHNQMAVGFDMNVQFMPNHKAITLYGENGLKVNVQGRYIYYALRLFKNVTFGLSREKDPVVILEDGKVVGAIMPLCL